MSKEQDILSLAAELAKTFKYWHQYQCDCMLFILPIDRIRYKSFYSEHKSTFNNLAKLALKYKFDAKMYVKFAVMNLKISEFDIKTKLISVQMFNEFSTYVLTMLKKKRIYKHFMKSIKNIAEECVKNDILTTKDFLRKAIKHKTLAGYFITGKISQYYFAAIPNFKSIVPKLDVFAKAEFLKIYDRFEMYNAEITDAYMLFKKCKVNPIKLTDDAIFELRNSKQVRS